MTTDIRVATQDDDEEDLTDLTDEEERLFIAIGFHKVHKAQALLSHARSLEIRGEHSCTPLLYAARYAKGEYATYFIKLFVRRGSDVNAQDDAGMTSLMHVILLQRSVDTMRPLIRCKKFDPDKQDKEGNTALMYAAKLGNSEAVANLLCLPSAPRYADVGVRNHDGLTALDIAVKGQHALCCQILVGEGKGNFEEMKDKHVSTHCVLVRYNTLRVCDIFIARIPPQLSGLLR